MEFFRCEECPLELGISEVYAAADVEDCEVSVTVELLLVMSTA